MKLLLFILLILASSAIAQTSSSVVLLEADGRLTKQCGAEPRVPPLPLPPPMNSTGFGLPKQLGGNCTEAILSADGTGGAAGYWCAQPDPEPARIYLFAVRWDAVTPSMVIDFSSLLLLANKADKITEIHKKYQSLDIRDMCDIWSPLVDRLNAIYPPPLPVAPQWLSIGGTIFTSNGTILTGITSRKVAAGVACITTVPAITSSGSRTYYPIVQGSNERVECRKATP